MRPGLERIEALLEALGPSRAALPAGAGGRDQRQGLGVRDARVHAEGGGPPDGPLHLAPPRLVPRAHPGQRRGDLRGRRRRRRRGPRARWWRAWTPACSRRPPRWPSTTSPAKRWTSRCSKSASAVGSMPPPSGTPAVAVITRVDLDHQAVLGSTLRRSPREGGDHPRRGGVLGRPGPGGRARHRRAARRRWACRCSSRAATCR